MMYTKRGKFKSKFFDQAQILIQIGPLLFGNTLILAFPVKIFKEKGETLG